MEEREKKKQENLELKEQISKMQQDFKSYDEKVQQIRGEDERMRKLEDERRHILYDMLDRELPGWKRKYYRLIGLVEKPLTPEARKKIEEALEWMRTHPNTDNAEEDWFLAIVSKQY